MTADYQVVAAVEHIASTNKEKACLSILKAFNFLPKRSHLCLTTIFDTEAFWFNAF